jgi:NADP-dependent 3-hydroxy acid dehydrogenase YdfG
MSMSTDQTPGRVAVLTDRGSSPPGQRRLRRDEVGPQRVLRGAASRAQILAFAVSRRPSVTLNEILIRPTSQAF